MGDGKDCRKYAYKCLSLVIDVGGKVYRTVFTNQAVAAKGSIKVFLTKNKNRIKRKCFKDQVEILYPNGTAASSADTFDITLLASLMRVLGQPKNESISNDLEKIKQYRNELMHIANTRTAFDETSFKTMWGEIAEVITKLGTTCKIPSLKTDIDELLKDPLDFEREEELQNKIESQKRTIIAWIDKEAKLDLVLQEIAGIKDKLDAHQEEVKDVMPKEYFEETKQYREAKQALLAHKIIVLNGAPGEGKTTMAKKLVTENLRDISNKSKH